MNTLLRCASLAALAALSLPMPSAQAADPPAIGVPSGYGRYCSLSYAGGGWAFSTLTGASSNPCGDMLASTPGGSIARAGLWSVSGENNAMAVCDGGAFNVFYRGTGSGPTAAAFNDAKGHSGCVFTVSPTKLPVFGSPYLLFIGTENTTNRFDYNNFNITTMPPSQFGRSTNASCPSALNIDRDGRQNCGSDNHGGYDYVMAKNNALVAVADGIVRKARWRDTTAFGGVCAQKSPQGEIYIEHSVGAGTYAERFLTYYAHAGAIDVVDGQTVTKGQVIGAVGDNGCSTTAHLHFSVQRLTNLSAWRSISVGYKADGTGVTTIKGLIDPYGWAAPQNVDPLATRFFKQDFVVSGVTETKPGAYSLNLWQSGAAPPSQ